MKRNIIIVACLVCLIAVLSVYPIQSPIVKAVSTFEDWIGRTFISTVATGIPPMTVNSTTKVDNFNADMVDGYHAWELGGSDNGTASSLLPASAIVISYYASETVKEQAFLLKSIYGDAIQICDGVDDDVEIQSAIDSLTENRTTLEVVKLIGEFYTTDSIRLDSHTGLDLTESVINSAPNITVISSKDVLANSTDIKIIGGKIIGNSSLDAISLTAVSNSLIQGVTISGFTRHGIVFGGTYPIVCNNNKIFDNDISNYGTGALGFGIGFVGSSDDNEIRGNKISSTQVCTGIGIDDNSGIQPSNPCYRNIITDNELQGMGVGVLIEGSYDNIVSNNAINATQDYGIQLAEGATPVAPARNIIAGNNINTTADYSIMVVGISNKIQGNTIKGGTYGIMVGDMSPGLGHNTRLSILDNMIENSTVGIYFTAGTSSKIEGNSLYATIEDGISVTSSNRIIQEITVMANTIIDSGHNAVLVTSTVNNMKSVYVDDNTVVNASVQHSDTYSGINIIKGTGILDVVSIKNNHITDNQGVATTKYAISVNGATSVDLGRNTISNMKTGEFYGIVGVSKIITASINLATTAGDIAYTVGFKPTAIVCTAYISNTILWCQGYADADKYDYSVLFYYGGVYSNSPDLLAFLPSSGNTLLATVKSYDVNGFTLTWTKTGSPAGSATIVFECFR